MIFIPIHKKARYLFSTYFGFLSLLAMIGGMIFGLFAFQKVDWQALRLDEESPKVMGVITESEFIGLDFSRNETFKLTYQFTLNEKSYIDYSYVSAIGIRTGSPVLIQYLESKPEVHRLIGTKNSYIPPMHLVMFILMVVGGTVTFLLGTIKQLHQLRILQNGVVSYGRCVHKSMTSDSYAFKRIFVLTFQYQTNNGKTIKAKTETHRLKAATDEEIELIIYDQRDPKKFTLADDFPDYLIGDIKNEALALDASPHLKIE